MASSVIQSANSPRYAIQVDNVTKAFVGGSPLRRMLASRSLGQLRQNEHNAIAVENVSFTVERGESLALIGRNGSGKTTLLEMIAGTVAPTEGVVHVNGKVAALLELGSGFDPALSGRENALLNGLLLGASRETMLSRMEAIAQFAELESVLDRPMSTYSTGMVVRLAFSTQLAIEPEILIVDEALSVGDFFFQQKCAAYIKQLRERGVTLLFVSHDMALVRDLCARAIFMERGTLKFDGEVSEASRRYYASSDLRAQAAPTLSSREKTLSPSQHASSTSLTRADALGHALWRNSSDGAEEAGAVLRAVSLIDSAGEPTTSFAVGEEVTTRVVFESRERLALHVSIELVNRAGQLVTCIGTYSAKTDVSPPATNALRVCDVQIALNIEAGEYGLRVVLATENGRVNQGDVIVITPTLGPMRVTWDYENKIAPHLGMFGLPHRVQFHSVEEAQS